MSLPRDLDTHQPLQFPALQGFCSSRRPSPPPEQLPSSQSELKGPKAVGFIPLLGLDLSLPVPPHCWIMEPGCAEPVRQVPCATAAGGRREAKHLLSRGLPLPSLPLGMGIRQSHPPRDIPASGSSRMGKTERELCDQSLGGAGTQRAPRPWMCPSLCALQEAPSWLRARRGWFLSRF